MLHAYLYTICFVFCYTSWRFYAFSRTNLLTRCHSASSLFSAIFVFYKKLHRKYSRNWTKQKPKFLFFPTRDEVQSRDGGGPGARRTIGWRGQLGHATRWCGRLAHLLTPPFCLYILLGEENLKAPINFHETYYKPPPPSTQDWEGPEALFGTLPEREITTEGLLHHHACLRSDV
jgi:hypothetical protein